MAKIRKQTYTMEMFMRYVRDKDIRDDADVQRAAGQWSDEQKNELIVTVLTEGYIPPVFIGEDMNGQKWLIDGLQRSSSLEMYRYGNYKVTSAIRNPIISYRAKQKSENGLVETDENGNVIWLNSEFDLKGKTYDDLPDELKKRFDSYQIETVIFEECTMEKMSELIQIYNNHTPMNTAQRAFTYISNYAREVREILNSRFFLDYSAFSDKEKTKGLAERAILESVMCIFHFDQWNKQMKKIGIFLNDHASKCEFAKIKEYLNRLENVITDDVKGLFNSKDTFLWLALFDKFSELKVEDKTFIDFLSAFKKGLKNLAVNGMTFDEVDKGKGTKDKAVIAAKLDILVCLMYDFLHVDQFVLQSQDNQSSAFDLIKRFVNADINEDDIDFHRDNLKSWTSDIADDSKIHDKENTLSLIAIAAYASSDEEKYDDETMVEWFGDYEHRNPDYISDQEENFLKMKKDLNQFVLIRQRQSVYA